MGPAAPDRPAGWRPPRFYFRAVLQGSTWKTIPVNTNRYFDHVAEKGAKEVICAEAHGDFSVVCGFISIWRMQFDRFPMKHDGSLDFSIDWAATMERLEAQMDKCVMESNDPASKIADFGVERRLRS